MTIDWVRKTCAKLPHVTEDVKWEKNLCFLIGDKMFAVVGLEPDEIWMSLKCSPDDFADLVEREGCRPAPYLARAQWVAFERPDALSAKEYESLLGKAYELIFAKLPKKVQRELGP